MRRVREGCAAFVGARDDLRRAVFPAAGACAAPFFVEALRPGAFRAAPFRAGVFFDAARAAPPFRAAFVGDFRAAFFFAGVLAVFFLAGVLAVFLDAAFFAGAFFAGAFFAADFCLAVFFAGALRAAVFLELFFLAADPPAALRPAFFTVLPDFLPADDFFPTVLFLAGAFLACVFFAGAFFADVRLVPPRPPVFLAVDFLGERAAPDFRVAAFLPARPAPADFPAAERPVFRGPFRWAEVEAARTDLAADERCEPPAERPLPLFALSELLAVFAFRSALAVIGHLLRVVGACGITRPRPAAVPSSTGSHVRDTRA